MSAAARFSSSPAVIRSPARQRRTIAITCSVATKAAKGSGLYVVLGIGERASIGEIKAAYRKMAKRWHPDVAGEEGAIIFLQIQQAYATLADPEERQRYDMSKLGLGLGLRERFCVRRRWETDQCW